jgi:hypothetical protein
MLDQFISLFGLIFGLACILFHRYWGSKLVEHFAKTVYRQHSETALLKEKNRASKMYFIGGLIFIFGALWKLFF